MAHVRRKFKDLLQLDPSNKETLKILYHIAQLYVIEAQAREEKYTPEKRQELREKESLPLMEGLKTLLLETTSQALPSSGLAKACNYALNQWKKLTILLTTDNCNASFSSSPFIVLLKGVIT